ncbi:unnamed protein product, partial [Cyprideis torosa]
FGGLTAVDNATLAIAKGSITGLIGPNGAGKTTLFNVIAGVHKPTSGSVLLDGEDITGLAPHELFHKGMLRTFQLLELGRTMMVDAKIVFLDEVGAGVNRTLLNTIGDAIIRLNQERDYTFCVIEHDMDFIDKLCDPVIVMAEGSVLAEGTLAEIKSNEQVIEAYLGTGLKNKVKP